jgi:hypothetical protein
MELVDGYTISDLIAEQGPLPCLQGQRIACGSGQPVMSVASF